MNRTKTFGLLMAACLVGRLWQTTAQSLASNKSKETKEEVTLEELKVWLDGKFETIDERFELLDKRFIMLMWVIGILAGLFVAFSAGTFAFTHRRMDRLEALILKNLGAIALNRTAIKVNKTLIEKESRR